jgi:hypothetical protein
MVIAGDRQVRLPTREGRGDVCGLFCAEVRSENEYFDEIQDVKVTKDMVDLANQKPVSSSRRSSRTTGNGRRWQRAAPRSTSSFFAWQKVWPADRTTLAGVAKPTLPFPKRE